MSGQGFTGKELAVPVGLLVVVGCMLIPLPALLLDVLLCCNLLFAILLVIGALHIRDPLKVTALPSLLLMATLCRLSLNLATTRAVLTHGHAGAAVEAFGSVVIQGSIVVGFVLFLLISLIQFIVVAKGAERVAEVAARFTLDALPGKQMAIDAEIRSGLLDPEAARRKRAEIQTESRFYGALDGAMKFVKGDAIAGLVVTFVNICGGLLVGIALQDLDFVAAVRKFTVLTIGDGLLSQIPSLLNSVAAGLIVTRVQANETSTLAGDLLSQIGELKAARAFVGIAAGILGCLPGMPHFALLGVAAAIGASLARTPKENESTTGERLLTVFEPSLAQSVHIEVSSAAVSALPALDDISQGVTELQSYAFHRWGLVIQQPCFSLWNDGAATYRVLMRGMEVSRSLEEPGPGFFAAVLSDVKEIIDLHREDLIDDGATRRALDYVEKQIPELVTGVVPAALSLTSLTGLLRSLLREGITTRHLDIILQVLAERAGRIGERELLAEVRAALSPVVSASVARNGKIEAAVLGPVLDVVLGKAEDTKSLVSGELVDALCNQIDSVISSHPSVTLISSKRARAYLRDIVRVRWDGISVIAHEEIAPRFICTQVASVEIDEQLQREALLSYAA